MLISDDGIGFSIEALNKFQSYGLIGIRERLRSSHGKLVIETAPGQGTTLVIFLPLAE
jgi:signal transduction histidine kinase